MNRVIISLLKGSLESKLLLESQGLNLNQLESLCKTRSLKEEFGLDPGYNFVNRLEIFKYIENKAIEIITVKDDAYPDNLRNIYDPPYLLYLKGDKKALKTQLVSVVGTRKATLRGLHESFKLGLELGRADVGVVSGLAIGIDAAAHLGNIQTNGKSVAVLGSGIDTVYPKENRALAGSIIENSGLIISEFTPGENPKKYNFPKRNRIIAGITRDLVIIQAPKKSGSLITGEYGLQNGSEIYVHTVGIGDSKFLGSDTYYKDGAVKIDSAYKILKKMNKDMEIKNFNQEDFTQGELTKLELSGAIVKYKGGYFIK